MSELLTYNLDDRVRAFLGRSPLRMLIGPDRVCAADESTFGVEDPATGVEFARVPSAGASDVDAAVRAAQRAFESWRHCSPAQRSERIHRVADLIEQHGECFAQLDSLDSGKPLANARGYDIPKAVEWFRYFAGWPTKVEDSVIPSPHGRVVFTQRVPIGVVGQIIPWNFPFMMAAWKLAPALAAGCTVVLKPAEQTPLSALYFAQILADAEILPAGVVNVVTGFGSTAGAALVAHPAVAKIAFTGSRETAQKIVTSVAGSLKRVTLELGGKSPNIVLGDVDVAAVAAEVSQAAFLNQGENCCAGTRLYVHEDQFADVVEAVSESARSFRLGPGLDEATTMGPLVSRQQHDRVVSYIEAGVNSGAELVVGGGTTLPSHPRGYFVEPTLFVDANEEASIVKEEIFGPVLVAFPFKTLEDVAARANASEYGLAAGIWTNDLRSAHALASMIDAGTVWINTYNETDPAVPFGGFKASGWGREHGRMSLDNYLETKSVWVNYERSVETSTLARLRSS